MSGEVAPRGGWQRNEGQTRVALRERFPVPGGVTGRAVRVEGIAGDDSAEVPAEAAIEALRPELFPGGPVPMGWQSQ